MNLVEFSFLWQSNPRLEACGADALATRPRSLRNWPRRPLFSKDPRSFGKKGDPALGRRHGVEGRSAGRPLLKRDPPLGASMVSMAYSRPPGALLPFTCFLLPNGDTTTAPQTPKFPRLSDAGALEAIFSISGPSGGFPLHWPSFGLPLLPEIALTSRPYLRGAGGGKGFALGVTAQRCKILLTPGV